MKILFIALGVISLAACATNQSKSSSGLMINPSIDLKEDIPEQPVFNEAHKHFLSGANDEWVKFSLAVYDQKLNLTKSTRKFLAEEGISDERITYLIDNEVWNRVNCEVEYLKDFDSDKELNIISRNVLKAISDGGDYSAYRRAFKASETEVISRNSWGTVIPIQGKEEAAYRFNAIVDRVNSCIDGVQDPVVFVPKK